MHILRNGISLLPIVLLHCQSTEKDLAKFKGDLAAAQAAAGDVNTKKPKAPKNPDPEMDQHNPYVCYNGMIDALIPYAIKGALWYQGESNGPSANIYREIMETLVADWRTRWTQGNFPFLYVQLANIGKPMTEPVQNNSMMTVREAQMQNLSIPNTAMAVAIEKCRVTIRKMCIPRINKLSATALV